MFRGTPDCNESAILTATAWILIVAQCSAIPRQVDRHATPGGHWVDSYGFVQLHQPAHFYGVPSMRLEREELGRELGGHLDLSSGHEIQTPIMTAAEDVSRLKAPCCTAMDWISFPRIALNPL